MALSPAIRFIVSVGGCALAVADPVVVVCPVAPGVGPEPASLSPVLQGPAYALPTLKTMTAQPARMSCLVIILPLLGFHPSTNGVFGATWRIYENKAAKRRFRYTCEITGASLSCSARVGRRTDTGQRPEISIKIWNAKPDANLFFHKLLHPI
jgi:hypothetical protein